MKYTVYLYIFSLIFSVDSLSAQSTYKLTVEELFDKGVQNSISIQSSLVRNEMSKDAVALAKNQWIPDLNIGGTVGYVGKPAVLNKHFSVVNHPNTPKWKQNYQVSINQPIFQGGRIKYGIERAELEEQIAELAVESDKQNLKLWLLNQYLDLFVLYKKRDVYTKNIEEASVRLHDIKKLKEQGMITANDVLRSQLLLTNYELALKETNNDIAVVSQQLAVVIGLDESLIFEPDPKLLTMEFLSKGESDYISLAYTQYPDLRKAKVGIESAKAGLKIAKSTLWPTLSLQASNTLARPIPNASPAKDFYLNAWGISLNLSYNISAWFDKKHSVGQAKRQVMLQELAEQQVKQNIRTEVRAALLKHNEAGDRLIALEKSLEQSQENYRIVKNKYFNQLAILTDLLDAENVQLNAELDYTVAQTNSVYTYYQLQKVSGSL